MKNFFLLSLAVVSLSLTGCGSSTKKSDKSGTGSASGSASGSAVANKGDETDVDESSGSDGPSLQTDNATSAANLDPKYKPLAQAIHAGRSKAITDQAARLLGTNAYDPTALNALALVHLKRGHTGAAKILLNKALERSQSAALYNNLGVALANEGDVAGAIVNFKRALKSDVSNQQTLGNLGSLYMKGGDVNRALPLLEQSYKANPSNLGIANNYAIALRSSGDLEGASRIYDAILKADPKNVYALLNDAILMIDFQNKPKDGLTLVYKLKFLETDKKDVVARANALEKKAKAGLQ
jgi:Flp pilus assembly protein TadD